MKGNVLFWCALVGVWLHAIHGLFVRNDGPWVSLALIAIMALLAIAKALIEIRESIEAGGV